MVVPFAVFEDPTGSTDQEVLKHVWKSNFTSFRLSKCHSSPSVFLYMYYKTKAHFPTFSTLNLFSALNGENILLHLIAKQQQQQKIRKKKSRNLLFYGTEIESNTKK